MLTKKQILEEYGKCLMDPVYAIENYLKTFDSQRGYVQFKLFPKQKEVIRNYEDYVKNLVTKPRQAGITTLTAAFIAVKLAFSDSESPERALILANKEDTAVSMLAKVKEFLDQFPDWVWGDNAGNENYLKKNTGKHIVLKNKSEAKALATSKDAARGFTPTMLMMDEAAFIDNGAEVYAASISTISTGGKAILVSTPNGYDPLYYQTYDRAKKGDNSYKVTEMRWYEDPRYNKDLKWVTENGDVIEEEEFTFESFRDKEEKGYKPTSTWYEQMCDSLNQDSRMIAQELDVNFLGSGGNVIEEEYINYHYDNNVKDPKWIEKDHKDGEIWIWEEPKEDHKYIISADPSRGDSDDYGVFTIVDFTTMEQVVEYQGKLHPDELAILIDKYGRHYNAYAVVDITGGMGVGTIRKLTELKYPKLHYDDPRTRALNSEEGKKKRLSENWRNKIPGFNANTVRTPMIANFESYVRHDAVTIRSYRLISEMKTFVYINGRPDHMKGFHDDAIQSLGMALWVLETSFKELDRLKSQNKAILDSWIDANDNGENNSGDYRGPASGTYKQPIVTNNNNEPPEASHAWLFM